MTTAYDDINSIPPGFTATDDLSQEPEVFDFYYNDEYDYGSEQSVYSEIAKNRNNRGIRHYSLLPKEGQIRLRREVPLNLQEVVGRKYVLIPLYETSFNPNRRIKNAITGISTPFRVGTHAENLFFKVCLADGIDGRKDPVHLYFETPSEYEKHLLETVPDNVKTEWLERYRVVENAYRVAQKEKKTQEPVLTFIH